MSLWQILASNNESVLASNAFDSEGISLPLEYSSDAKSSRLLGSLDPKV